MLLRDVPHCCDRSYIGFMMVLSIFNDLTFLGHSSLINAPPIGYHHLEMVANDSYHVIYLYLQPLNQSVHASAKSLFIVRVWRSLLIFVVFGLNTRFSFTIHALLDDRDPYCDSGHANPSLENGLFE
jgi:hypothetical protein